VTAGDEQQESAGTRHRRQPAGHPLDRVGVDVAVPSQREYRDRDEEHASDPYRREQEMRRPHRRIDETHDSIVRPEGFQRFQPVEPTGRVVAGARGPPPRTTGPVTASARRRNVESLMPPDVIFERMREILSPLSDGIPSGAAAPPAVSEVTRS